MATSVKTCTCVNSHQDALHGPGRRVMNSTAKSQWRCSVCGTLKGDEKSVSAKKEGKK